jgi:iron complex outermembrane receptor protein
MTNSFDRNLGPVLLAAISLSWLFLIQPALAQEQQAAAANQVTPASAVDTEQLQEVVVIADKQEINLQRAPESITALNAATLDVANIVSPDDLNGFVPGLTLSPNEGENRVASIRGIGNEANQNGSAQPGVAYHVDGVYIASPYALSGNFLDVDRIEVLRGPQGTVFGQNSTGGTLNVITRQPDLNASSGYAAAGGGTYDLFRGEAALNVPVSDTVAVRGAVLEETHGGFAQATEVPGYPHGYPLDNENTLTGRLAILWKPFESFSLKLAADTTNMNENDPAQKSIFDPNPDPRQLTQDYPGTLTMSSQIYSATAAWDVTGITIKDIASYQYVADDHSFDRDRLTYALSPLHDLNPVMDNDVRSYTEELNISSNASSPFQWIAGAFYLHTSLKTCELETTTPIGVPVPQDCLTLDPGVSLSDIAFQTASTSTRKSWSVFGQGSYAFASRYRLITGIRYTNDQDSSIVSDNYNAFGPPTHDSLTSTGVTGKVSFEDDLTLENMLYGTWSTGLKPGGANLNQTPILAPLVFQPEHVISYEVGSKNRFFDNTVQLNVSGYYYLYKNLQLQEDDPVPFQGGVGNIDRSEIFGLEAESAVALPDQFKIDWNVGLEHGRVTSHQTLLDGYEGNLAQLAAAAQGYGLFSPQDIAARETAAVDVYGKRIPKLPSVTAGVVLSKSLQLAGQYTLVSSLAAVYRGGFQARIFNEPVIDSVPSYAMFNINFRFFKADLPWQLELAFDNVTNKDGVAARFVDAFGTATDAGGRGVVTDQYIPPRQVIATVHYRF